MAGTEQQKIKVPRIVVGVDGSESSLQALDWAISQARSTGATVKVVQGWLAPVAYGYIDVSEMRREAEHALESAVKRAEPGDVVVTTALVDGSPSHVLVEAGRRADLLVVGTRGHGGFAGLLLGSVSNQVVHHATCPVVVIPPKPVVEERAHKAGAR